MSSYTPAISVYHRVGYCFESRTKLGECARNPISAGWGWRGQERLLSQASKLKNVRILPFSRGALARGSGSADISLVILNREWDPVHCPPKHSPFCHRLALCWPVWMKAAIHWNFIERSKSGMCVSPENPTALAQAILLMKNDPARLRTDEPEWTCLGGKISFAVAAAEQFESLFYGQRRRQNND